MHEDHAENELILDYCCQNQLDSDRCAIVSINPFVGRENSTKSAQSGRKIFYPENLYPGGFEGADYESELEIQNGGSNMVDENAKTGLISINIGSRGLFRLLITNLNSKF